MVPDNLKSHLRWLGLTLVLKVAFVLLCWSLIHVSFGIAPQHQHYLVDWWGYPWGDTHTYLDPMENLLQHGTYSPDVRMPGYGVFYLLIRLFFSLDVTMRLLIVLHFVMSITANYALARAAFLLTRSRIVFFIVLGLYCVSLKNIKWEFIFMTESLTASFLALSFYFLVAHTLEETRRRGNALMSGLFLGWAIFMRPVYFPLIVLFAITILLSGRPKINWKHAIVFLIPFVAADMLWVGRNFIVHNRFIPLIKQVYMDEINKDYTGALLNFMNATGSAITLYNPSGELAWYMPQHKSHGKHSTTPFDPKPPPEWLHTSRFNRDSLDNLRGMIYRYEDSTLTSATRDSLNREIVVKLESYTQSVRDELPWVYYVKARLLMMRRHLVTTSTDFLPHVPFHDMSLQLQVVKVLYSTLYVITLGFSLASLAAFWIINRKLIAIPLGMLYGVLINPVVGLTDVRYLAPAYPLMIICAVYFGWWLTNYISSKVNERSLGHRSGI